MEKKSKNQIEKFLSLENPSEPQIIEAATLLLRLSPQRSKGIYNSALRRPKAMLPWIRTDLKKHLDIHNRGLNRDTVDKYNNETLDRARETLSMVPEGVEDDEDAKWEIPVLGVKGKRADHEKLPEDIKNIFEKNSERWKKMRQIHHQLSVMIKDPGYAACDGNELCFQIRKLDDDQRADWERYDNASQSAEKDNVEVFTDNVKTIQNARTAISRGLARKTQNEESINRLQESVNTLYALKQTLKPETIGKLNALGVVVPTE